MPPTVLTSGYSGALLMLPHVPMWMWVGCAPAGAFLSETTTLTPPATCVNVAVPVSPLWLSAASGMVIATGVAADAVRAMLASASDARVVRRIDCMVLRLLEKCGFSG